MNCERDLLGVVLAVVPAIIDSKQLTNTPGARGAPSDRPLVVIVLQLVRAPALIMLAVVLGGLVMAGPQRWPSAFVSETANGEGTTSSQETLTLKGHILSVLSVAFSADGKRLASASLDHTVKVWDATPRRK